MEFNRIFTVFAMVFLVFFSGLLLAAPLPVMGMTNPSMEAEVGFVVYPDGTVGLTAKSNMTSISPDSGLTAHVQARTTKEDNVQITSINATLAIPPREASQFPYNATSASMTTGYLNGVAKSDINASVILPGSPQGTPGLSGFPFDSADFTLTGDYSNQSFNGTITAHLVPGLTLADIHMNFQGNLTRIAISDSVQVFYNYTLPIPGFPSLNETYLGQTLQMLASTMPGKGPGSLYNTTSGAFECTTFNTTITPIDLNSARVSFVVVVEGDFIRFLVNTYAGAGINPGGVPGPALNSTIVYSLLNATCYSTKSGRLTMAYSRVSRRFDVQAEASMDLKEYWNATTKVISQAYPPSIQPYFQSMFNTTFCSVSSFNETVSYSNGQISYNSDYAFEGDLNAEVNQLKNAYIDIMNATGSPQGMMSFMKECYVDISNLAFTLDLDSYSTMWSFENVKVTPPTDPINATCFKLRRFFNLTSSPSEPPRENEKLKLIVQGGHNETHSVTLFIDPNDANKLSDPDQFGAENTMTWNNMSISKLQPLTFKVWEGRAETIHTPTSVTDANPLTIDTNETAGCTLTLTNVSRPTTISVKNVTSPSGVGPTPSTYQMVGTYIQITADPEDVTVNGTMRIYYSSQQLATLGISEDDLKIYYWDATASSWASAETHVNTAEHCAWTVVNHLSTWALLAQPTQALWEQPWFIISIVVVIIAILAGAALVLRRKRQSPQKTKTAEATDSPGQ